MIRRNKLSEQVIQATDRLSRELGNIDFASAAAWVYNPLEYAWNAHQEYLTRYLHSPKVLFMGMNPGPWGMVQTGIPFGEVSAVRDWLKIQHQADRPERELACRPIEGFQCHRSEVSGQRLWGLFANRFQTPQNFFQEHFVINYCPLAFMAETGRNITPDKLPQVCRKPLEAACDRWLATILQKISPFWVIGVGGFAYNCLRRTAMDDGQTKLGQILHPSPASPVANRGWADQATRQLIELGVWCES